MGASAYTRERLEEAARGARTLSEALGRLGVDPRSSTRRYVFERMKKLGVDVSHFEREGMRWTREILEAAVSAFLVEQPVGEARRQRSSEVGDDGNGRAGAMRSLRYGGGLARSCAPSGGHHVDGNWRDNRIENLRFLCPNCHSTTGSYRGRGKMRTEAPDLRPRNRERRFAESVSIAGTSDQRRFWSRTTVKRRTRTYLLRRALGEIGVPEVCAECGVGPEWLGKPMTLEVDHINGDWSDDRRENLRLLCPHCHAITNTWCRGGRRPSTVGRSQAPVRQRPSGDL